MSSLVRSNYFYVRDVNTFTSWILSFENYEVLTTEHNGDILYGFCCEDGGIPCWDEEDNEIDFVADLAHHLVFGEVAVIMIIGNDKMRSLGGTSYAINYEGIYREVDLSDIYDSAKEIGNLHTLAEY